ncbi:DUF397 domain-containing protein [Streptomyces sp. NBC_00654]|uniref:DUF397 domain-containing protein n=1 Tax=Streptomyces sp. NBC_00654 TaxID=2975799 RepID=UPI00225B75F3|nr:DUF397 domain-containing protein [Streptomyces sp. NBC_00654]MCX4969597.1 DUF397 domain-containing protein [Streptomyces sp. NBC_00654]
MVPHIPSDEALTWSKSSYSGGNTTECLEVASLALGVAVRDSKRAAGPRLTFGATAWEQFIEVVRDQASAIPVSRRTS